MALFSACLQFVDIIKCSLRQDEEDEVDWHEKGRNSIKIMFLYSMYERRENVPF